MFKCASAPPRGEGRSKISSKEDGRDERARREARASVDSAGGRGGLKEKEGEWVKEGVRRWAAWLGVGADLEISEPQLEGVGVSEELLLVHHRLAGGDLHPLFPLGHGLAFPTESLNCLRKRPVSIQARPNAVVTDGRGKWGEECQDVDSIVGCNGTDDDYPLTPVMGGSH